MRMFKMLILTGLLLGFALEYAEVAVLDCETTREQWYLSPSFLPEQEPYVHIAGGFFSVFGGRVGSLFPCREDLLSERQNSYQAYCRKNECCGSLCIKLKKLKYSSRFVYLPEGEIILNIENSQKVSFTMQKLDYVSSYDDDGFLYYRIYCRSSGNYETNAYLVCFATESTSPVLFGFFIILSDTGIEKKFAVRIGGRNENQAENHLQKVIVAVTEL
jgi:hypothetical protein